MQWQGKDCRQTLHPTTAARWEIPATVEPAQVAGTGERHEQGALAHHLAQSQLEDGCHRFTRYENTVSSDSSTGTNS